MANLPETPQWEEGVYQIEVSDPVLGGLTGYLTGRLNSWPAALHTLNRRSKKAEQTWLHTSLQPTLIPSTHRRPAQHSLARRLPPRQRLTTTVKNW